MANVRCADPENEVMALAAINPTIAPLPHDYPHHRTITALRRHGLELAELSAWRNIAATRQWTWAEAAEIVRGSRRKGSRRAPCG